MLKLALRNILRQGFRTVLTLVAIVFGVVGLLLSGGFVEDVFVQLREATIHSQIGHVQLAREGYMEFGRREPYAYLLEDPQALARIAASEPRVQETLTRLGISGLASNGRADLPVLAEGVQPDREARLGTLLTIIEGRQLQDGDAYGALVGKGVAKSLRLAPGASLNLLAATPDGAMNSVELEVVGVFQSFSVEYDDRVVRLPLGAAQELLDTPGAHTVVLSLTQTDATDAVVARLSAGLQGAGYEVMPWHRIADFYQKTVDLYRQQFGVLQLIVLVMVVLSVANSVNMAIFERTGEFGTLMALGNRRRHIFLLLMMEYTLLGAAGAAIGLGLGVLLALGINLSGIPMPPPPGSEVPYTAYVRLAPWTLATAFLVGSLASVLAAILPAAHAARLAVVDALRANV